jgi:hypothetical protein
MRVVIVQYVRKYSMLDIWKAVRAVSIARVTRFMRWKVGGEYRGNADVMELTQLRPGLSRLRCACERLAVVLLVTPDVI